MNKILKNSIASFGTNALYLISRLALTPYILYFISLEEFALWSISFIIISYIGLSGSGIGNAFITNSAKYYKNKDYESLNKLISTGTLLLLSLSTFILILVFLYRNFILGFFHIEDKILFEKAQVLLIGTCIMFLIELSFEAFENFFEGIEEILLTKTIWIIANFLEVILVVVFLKFGMGLYGLLYAYGIKAIFKVICHFYYLRKYIKIRILIDFKILKGIFHFALRVQLLSFIGIFMNTFNQLIVANLLGLYKTGLFELGKKLPQKGQGIISGVFVAFMPASAQLKSREEKIDTDTEVKNYVKVVFYSLGIGLLFYTFFYLINDYGIDEKSIIFIFLILILFTLGTYLFKHYLLKDKDKYLDREKIVEIYSNGSIYVNFLIAFIYSFMIVFADRFLYIWVGRNEVEVLGVMVIFILGIGINLGTGVGTSILRGLEKTHYEIEYALMNLILAFVLIITLTKYYGLFGGAIGTSLSTIIASIYFILRVNRYFNIDNIYFLRKNIKKPIYLLLISLLSKVITYKLYVVNRWISLIYLAISFSVYLLLIYFIFKFVLKDNLIDKFEGFIKRKI